MTKAKEVWKTQEYKEYVKEFEALYRELYFSLDKEKKLLLDRLLAVRAEIADLAGE